MPSRKKSPDAELQELEVREVSLVDRPANLSPWLIVKRATEEGGQYILEEDTMGKKLADEITAALLVDGIEVIDLLANDGDQPPASVVEKVDKAEAMKRLEAVVGKLMPIANTVKGAGSLNAETAEALKAIAKELASLAGAIAGKEQQDEQAEKAAPGEQVSGALARLMKAVNTLKGAGDEVPGDLPKELKAIAAMLMAAAAQQADEGEGDKEARKEEGRPTSTTLHVFQIGKGEDPEFITVRAPKDLDAGEVLEQVAKAGAKIKRARLSKLMEAWKILGAILKEVGALEDKKDDKVTKAIKLELVHVPPPTPVPQPEFTTLIDSVKDVVAKVDGVVERVSALEAGGGTPEGDGADRVTKNDSSIWGGKIIGNRR